MTRNQIEYWKLQEEKRSNRAGETETRRANLARETESHRSNLANERENARSNRARENLQREGNVINSLHLERQDAENERANRASEALRADSNAIERERITLGYTQAAANREVGMANAGVGYAQVAESTRANMANEAERSRSNKQQEVVNYINAYANRQNADTRQREQSLKEYQYSDTGRDQAQSNAFLNRARAIGVGSQLKSDNYNRAQIFSNVVNNNANTYSNSVGRIGSLLKPISTILKPIGGLAQ